MTEAVITYYDRFTKGGDRMFENILLIILAIVVGFLVGNQLGMNWKIKTTEKKINIHVVTKTKHRYKAIAYRMGLTGPEIKLYNYHTRKHEWWDVYDLENPILVICQCDPDYTLRRYGESVKNLTEAQLMRYNNDEKSKRSD